MNKYVIYLNKKTINEALDNQEKKKTSETPI